MKLSKPLLVVILLLIALLILFMLIKSHKNEEYIVHTVKISQLLSASIFLAEQGGKKVREVRQNKDPEILAKVKGHTKEGAAEYVTLGDQKSHAIIMGGLISRWPKLNCLSEESNSHTNLISSHPPIKHREVNKYLKRDEEVNINDVSIWIDPLDATQEYTEGGTQPDLLKYVMVMVCIVVDDYPVAGVIHQPFVKSNVILIKHIRLIILFIIGNNGQDGITYWGWVNHGVSSTVMKGKDSTNSEKIRVISSRSHSGDVKQVAITALGDENVEQIIAAGAGYKTLQVSQNKADLYLHTTKIKKWDTCAGNALLNAVGGQMTTRSGKKIDYTFRSNPTIESGLIATLTQANYNKYSKNLIISNDN